MADHCRCKDLAVDDIVAALELAMKGLVDDTRIPLLTGTIRAKVAGIHRSCPGAVHPQPNWQAILGTLEKLFWKEMSRVFTHRDERTAVEPFLQALRDKRVAEKVAASVVSAISQLWTALDRTKGNSPTPSVLKLE